MNESTQRYGVSGLFTDRESAERAYTSLRSRGYTDDDVNLVMSDDTRKRYFSDDADSGLGNKAMEGAGAGSAIGGTVGAVLAALAAIGTNVVLPGLGLVVAGPLAAALAGAGAGGLTGGLIGALVGSGIPEEHAAEYESGVKSGGIYMGVNPRTREDAEFFENEWRTSGGQKIHGVGTTAGALGGAATGAALGSVVPGVGNVVGGVVGGVAGAVAGHGTAEAINPSDDDDRRRV